MIWLSLALAADRVPEDFATLQEAVDLGTSEQIVVSSAYRGPGARIDRRVDLVGERGATIDLGRPGRFSVGIELLAGSDGTRIRGITFDCDGTMDGGVVSREGAREVAVVGNRFVGCVQGVTFTGRGEVVDADVRGNDFVGLRTVTAEGGVGGGIGVMATQVGGLRVVGNRFGPWADAGEGFATAGVGLAGCERCSVVGNVFAVRADALHAAVVDLGARRTGVGASSDLVVADNDASGDDAPWFGVSFVVGEVDGVLVEGNLGGSAP